MKIFAETKVGKEIMTFVICAVLCLISTVMLNKVGGEGWLYASLYTGLFTVISAVLAIDTH